MQFAANLLEPCCKMDFSPPKDKLCLVDLGKEHREKKKHNGERNNVSKCAARPGRASEYAKTGVAANTAQGRGQSSQLLASSSMQNKDPVEEPAIKKSLEKCKIQLAWGMHREMTTVLGALFSLGAGKQRCDPKCR